MILIIRIDRKEMCEVCNKPLENHSQVYKCIHNGTFGPKLKGRDVWWDEERKSWCYIGLKYISIAELIKIFLQSDQVKNGSD